MLRKANNYTHQPFQPSPPFLAFELIFLPSPFQNYINNYIIIILYYIYNYYYNILIIKYIDNIIVIKLYNII